MIHDIVFWLVLGGAVLVHWILPASWRRPVLAVISFAFIVYCDALSAAIIAAMSWVLLPLLPRIARRNRLAAGLFLLSIIATAGPLIVFKFTANYGLPWLDGSVLRHAVPLGMSYYVFRLIHLAIEAYRFGDYPRTTADYFSYAFLFTIFVAGPIQRYRELVTGAADRFEWRFMGEGLMRMAAGLIKQTVLIDSLGWLRDMFVRIGPKGVVFDQLEKLPADHLWIVLIVSYLTAYLNLSAYSDIAIGASRLFGLTIMENFNFPVAARNLTEYWRRWHMTLSGWCQDYVFSPTLGATRNPYIALIASFQVMGLWHMLSLNRVAWGLHQAIGLASLYIWKERTRKWRKPMAESRIWALAAWVITQAFVTIGFLFVINESSNDILESLALIPRLLTFGFLR